MQPTIGRIVHYVLPFGPNAGASRPAIIVEVAAGETAHLTAFLLPGDGRDTPVGDTILAPIHQVEHDEGGTPGTWHWPPRV